jgi:hypothetical protein
MTDYDPRLDKPVYDDVVMTPKAPSRGLYLVVGVVAAIVAAAGLMFFSGNTADRNDMARSPDPAGIGATTNAPRTPEVPRITPIPATRTPEPVPAPGQQQ